MIEVAELLRQRSHDDLYDQTFTENSAEIWLHKSDLMDFTDSTDDYVLGTNGLVNTIGQQNVIHNRHVVSVTSVRMIASCTCLDWSR